MQGSKWSAFKADVGDLSLGGFSLASAGTGDTALISDGRCLP